MYEPMEFKVTNQDLSDVNITNILNNAKTKQCSEYRSIFEHKRREVEKDGNIGPIQIFDLLSYVFSFFLIADDPKKPFKTLFNNQPTIEDLTDPVKK